MNSKECADNLNSLFPISTFKFVPAEHFREDWINEKESIKVSIEFDSSFILPNHKPSYMLSPFFFEILNKFLQLWFANTKIYWNNDKTIFWLFP